MSHSFAFCAFVAAYVCSCTNAKAPIQVLNLSSTKPTRAELLSLQVCAGFHNGNRSNTALVYSILDSSDESWLRQLYSDREWLPISAETFLAQCLSHSGQRVLQYSFSEQQVAVPSLITIATALRLVPMENTTGLHVGFDALSVFGPNVTALEVTRYAYTHYINKTSGLAIMDPGYADAAQHPFNPPLTGSPNLALVDFIVQEQLFNMYMLHMCIPGTEEHELMKLITSNNRWARPIPVYGYNNAIPLFGGDSYEADTTCTAAFDMGAVASSGVNNLAFFSSVRPPITAPLQQNAPPHPREQYNSTQTYVAWVVGDGDNVDYVEHGKASSFAARMAACSNSTFPLMWTISPHLHRLAPDILEWYYAASTRNQCDYFMLPPSGALYSYPALMQGDVQDMFVQQTEELCTLYNTSATVDWEVAGSWAHAVESYLPKYASRNIVRGFFSVNVPYPFPVPEFGADEFFKVVENNTVIFKPREWRGTGGSSPFSKEFYTVQQMAEEVNTYPKGTVTWAYMTSDGGAHWPLFEQLAALLEPHVHVVTADALSDLALQKSSKYPSL